MSIAQTPLNLEEWTVHGSLAGPDLPDVFALVRHYEKRHELNQVIEVLRKGKDSEMLAAEANELHGEIDKIDDLCRKLAEFQHQSRGSKFEQAERFWNRSKAKTQSDKAASIAERSRHETELREQFEARLAEIETEAETLERFSPDQVQSVSQEIAQLDRVIDSEHLSLGEAMNRGDKRISGDMQRTIVKYRSTVLEYAGRPPQDVAATSVEMIDWNRKVGAMTGLFLYMEIVGVLPEVAQDLWERLMFGLPKSLQLQVQRSMNKHQGLSDQLMSPYADAVVDPASQALRPTGQ